MKTFHIATDEDDVDALVKEEAIRETTQPSQAVRARRAAAGRGAAQAQTYTPMSLEDYWKIVRGYAEGRRSKSGGDLRETWIQTTHAGEAEIAKFDQDVQNYRDANNL